MRLSAFAGMMLILAATPAFATMSVTPTLVRSGYFQAPDCTATADPKAYNECVCEADIRKASVLGLSPAVTDLINGELAMLPEKLAAESCEGTPTTPPAAGINVNKASANFKVEYQTASTLTVLITYSTYGAGAAHALDGTEGFTFDLASGKLVDPIQYLKPEELKKANSYARDELMKKYPDVLFDEAKARIDPYLTENGCDTCTLFYGKDGWVMRFQIYSIAPYAVGEPEIYIPADIMAAPETLIAKK
ncbi:MAG: RsiV family protein [Pseudomonadota bacterium]